MATIDFKKLRDSLADHKEKLDKQIEKGTEKLQQAVEAANAEEIDRITKELECRGKAKTVLDGIIVVAPLMCCDQFQNCPDI